MLQFNCADVSIKKLGANILSQGVSLQMHDLVFNLIRSKLDFVDMLVMYGKDKDALRENDLIFNLLNNLQTDENNLKMDAEEQQICIGEMLQERQRKAKGKYSVCNIMDFKNILTSPCMHQFMTLAHYFAAPPRAKTPVDERSQRSSPNIFLDKTPESKNLSVTPVGLGKKRPPLKLVDGSNHLLVPLTDEQFFSPKVSSDLMNRIVSDDDDDHVIPERKENVSRMPRRLVKSPANNVGLQKPGVTSVVPDVEEKVGVAKNIKTKSVRPSNPNSTYVIDDKPTSSRRASSKTLNNADKPPISRRVTSRPASIAEKPLSSQRAADPIDNKLPAQKVAITKSRALAMGATTAEGAPTKKETTSSKANGGNATATTRSLAPRADAANARSAKSSSNAESKEGKEKTAELKCTKTKPPKLPADVSEESVKGSVRETRLRRRL